ncbi:MAG: neutral/alkaline non-lysosomal ceramidase N-terminal domain-containing protein [Pirellulales bacterium]|nr:neutral/alkaline non-lysosomal ceramidase N-terminal domain-containing protein [Pirellulales bacterium]
MTVRNISLLALLIGASLIALVSSARGVDVGFASGDITPDVQGKKPVWIAGYGQNRRATGVHDPLFTRAIVLRDGQDKIALVANDVVGLQYPTVKQIRESLKDFTYVLVASTHNHEGPDTIGMWGPSPIASGVDKDWIDTMVAQTVETVRAAEAAAVPAKASYGTAQDDTLLRDSRIPKVYDGVLRALRFNAVDDGRLLGLLVQWNCHPECMGSQNTQITADFPWATIKTLEEKYNDCPIVYFSGAVGGLMAPPREGRIKDADGKTLGEGDFEFCRLYGEEVGQLAAQAIESSTPLELAPFTFAAKPISVPMQNPVYQMGRMLGILKRDGFVWTGNSDEIGPVMKRGKSKELPAAETEVSYVRLGDLHIAGIPGEVYPESVYGQYQEPVEPNADFADAPLEPSIESLMPGDKWLLIGLANDELGYIVPKRQWDNEAPFAYGRSERQYGEENSIGPETAPLLIRALEMRVKEANAK